MLDACGIVVSRGDHTESGHSLAQVTGFVGADALHGKGVVGGEGEAGGRVGVEAGGGVG